MENKFKQWIERSSKILKQRIDENNTDLTDLEEELELRKEMYSSFENKEKEVRLPKIIFLETMLWWDVILLMLFRVMWGSCI